MKRSGRELDFHVEPNDPRCMEAGTLFSDLLGRAVRPINSIRTERVNNLPVHESPYRPVLEALGFKKAYKGYILRGPV